MHAIDNGFRYSEDRDLPFDDTLALYVANNWSAAQKPDLLLKGLLTSHRLITAWHGKQLVGLGNAISDGFLVVYYSHLLVLPEYKRRGIGTEIMRRIMAHYAGFHQQVILAAGDTPAFYRKCGFAPAATMEPMWIYAGQDH